MRPRIRLYATLVVLVVTAILAIIGAWGPATLAGIVAMSLLVGPALMRMATGRRPGRWTYGPADRDQRD